MNEPLVDEILAQLRRHGSARSTPDQPAKAWRAAAQRAARELGRPVETIEHDGQAHAALRDWPANELEREIQQRALRRAVREVGQ